MEKPIPNSYWLIPGRLAAGEYPGDVDGAREPRGRLRSLILSGIDRFIDLTEAGEVTRYGELPPYEQEADVEAERAGRRFQYSRHPIRDHHLPADEGATREILDAIDQALERGENVYLHCWGGVGRTGTVAGCWLVRHGMTGEQALERLAEAWQGVDKIDRRPTTPGNELQREYVRRWREPQI